MLCSWQCYDVAHIPQEEKCSLIWLFLLGHRSPMNSHTRTYSSMSLYHPSHPPLKNFMQHRYLYLEGKSKHKLVLSIVKWDPPQKTCTNTLKDEVVGSKVGQKKFVTIHPTTFYLRRCVRHVIGQKIHIISALLVLVHYILACDISLRSFLTLICTKQNKNTIAYAPKQHTTFKLDSQGKERHFKQLLCAYEFDA